ncbi:YVTN family beta-propeller repeat protein [Cellulosilyticum sp. I15G10I2]|uniref:YVTN family beta-propeller repeat protein n=1 Tax=Cellulosilyticum sp. I15G10I2 TaxID=1892843 RepID=UPI00085C1590|nr:YncE family protein [Cellulosilyticum sp. I15G10I2]
MTKSKLIKFMASSAIFTLAFTGCANAPNNNVKQPDTVQVQEQTQETQVQETPAPTPAEVKLTYYYTANESGSISKIDSITNKVIDTIQVDGSPHNIQISSDGQIVAFTVAEKMTEEEEKDENMEMNMDMKGEVFFYDTNTRDLVKQMELGKHPAYIVFTEDGKYVLVTDSKDNNVSILDAKTYEVLNTIAVGKGPNGFRISKDSKFAYIANMEEDTVSVIDIENSKEIKKITVGETPVTTAITSDGKTLLVTVSSENVLAVINLATDAIEKIAVGTNPAQVYLQSDDQYAFVANQGTKESPSNTVSKIDMGTKTVIATTETGKGAHGVVVTNDNKYVYVTNKYENTISVIDNTTGQVISTVQVDEGPNGISYRE